MQNNIIINNQLINYRVYNQGGSQALVFLHGWRSDSSVWIDISKRISDKNYAVYLIDLPGFGSSALPLKTFSVQDYADIVINFIKKLGLKNVVLIGHSFGGRIAIKNAAQNYPLITKLVLIDSAGLKKEKSGIELNMFKFIAKIAKPFFKPAFVQKFKARIYKKIGAEDYISTPKLKKTFLKVINENLEDYLPHIQQATLIIWGEKDKETILKSARIMEQKINNSRLVILEDAGHFSFLDKPIEFCGAFLDFVSKN